MLSEHRRRHAAAVSSPQRSLVATQRRLDCDHVLATNHPWKYCSPHPDGFAVGGPVRGAADTFEQPPRLPSQEPLTSADPAGPEAGLNGKRASISPPLVVPRGLISSG